MTAIAPVQVAPGVHRVSVPLPFPPREVAAWLIEGAEGHTLVDTGMDTPSARGALRDGAARLGVTPQSLTHVVLTHAHIDHYGLAGPVRAWSGAQVALHAREEELARRFVDGWPQDRDLVEASFRAGGVPDEVGAALLQASDRIHGGYVHFEPDILLRGDAGALPSGGGWEWILTPGHSPGHVTVYHPERRILIAGDHVLPRISPNIGADLYTVNPLADYLESLARLRELPVDLVLPSHGEPVHGPGRAGGRHRRAPRGAQRRHAGGAGPAADVVPGGAAPVPGPAARQLPARPARDPRAPHLPGEHRPRAPRDAGWAGAVDAGVTPFPPARSGERAGFYPGVPHPPAPSPRAALRLRVTRAIVCAARGEGET
ncbi:MAG TPA: MBL fold metallo-hydrolase [Longimicrobium sp.]|nr:MBL fold metallo-hydrolase [Longimicrobium sp.]